MKSTLKESFLGLLLILFCLLATLLGVIQLITRPATTVKATNEQAIGSKWVSSSGEDRLAYITLNGMISEDGPESSVFSHESPSAKVRKLLYFAAQDNHIKGVLLRINSPGGTVGMSQELYHAVLAVRKQKPIVASLGDVAASGAYYTAAAADKIVANPGTLTASIGVILQGMNLQGLLSQKLGVKAVTIKSGQFKDILSPYREPSAAELQLLQKMVNTSYQQFLGDVLAGRTLNMKDSDAKRALSARIKAVADGRVVPGEEAIKVGLIDELGGLQQSKELLQKLIAEEGVRHAERLPLQEYDIPFNVWEFIGTGAKLPIQLNAGGANPMPPLPLSMRYANQPLWLMEQYQ